MFIICICDAFLNLYENRKSFIVFTIFLIISFTGIIVTDSLIYSVSQRAESELKIQGDNVITIDFRTPVTIEKVNSFFSSEPYSISFSKRSYLNFGGSPLSEEIHTITGVDPLRIKLWGIKTSKEFTGNVIIFPASKRQPSSYINGIPFYSVATMNSRSTDFLDSLGLKNNNHSQNIVMPLETMFRFTIDNNIDNVELIKKTEVTNSDITSIMNILTIHGINDYNISSYLDAKETVRNVMNRFSILTNAVYIMLTIMALVVVHTIINRNFQLRNTEFAIKVIHGVNKNIMILVVVIETFIVTIASVCLSLFISYIMKFFLSRLLHAEIVFRFNMVLISLLLVIAVCNISGILSGLSFFKKNPLQILKERML